MPETRTFAVLVNRRVTARGLSQFEAWREAEATESLRPDVRVDVRAEED